ncbi:MAG: peptidoglycan DD-metalloendopeptidase family protein [Chloroflexota bacterium]|nr:peptidoglycan DD-metalloendopeptidase family protein [Chloroflexota bacterium]
MTVIFRPFLLLLVALLGLLIALPFATRAAPDQPVEADVQVFLDAQPGPLKSYREGERTAAELIQAADTYYGISPRILLALLEATGGLLSDSAPPDQVLRQPFGSAGPDGFTNQLDWAGRELRAGLGPYDRAPTVRFTDGTTLTLTLQQAPEGVAVQRFLAKGRDQAAWRAAVDRFGQAFQLYFNNELPEQRRPQPVASAGFLQRPWAAGTRVVHLAYFDHMFPTVDTERPDNGFVVNYLGRGNMQYDGHDGHDFYFPNQPSGTYILAAADGIAHSSTHRGNGVWIEHPDGYVTVYWHLDKFASIFRGKLDTGQGVPVRAGDLIGSSGKTGFVVGSPHLHFEVRHNGKQVDPYGWYGSGTDPCVAYVACEASVWLWSRELVGEFDWTPPDAAPEDRAPPDAALAINPPADLLFLARFDGSPLQQIGAGMPTVAGKLEYGAVKFGAGARVAGSDRLAFATAGNLQLDAGTIAFWAQLPERYPETANNRQYLLAASAHADEGPVYTATLALRRDLLGPNGGPQWNFWTTPESGEAGRNDLTAPDTLAPGLHHFAITWDRAQQSKALYLDGTRVNASSGVELPADVGATLDLGRWAQGANAAGVTFDELAIFDHALDSADIAQLAAAAAPLPASAPRVTDPNLTVETHAIDDGGAIMTVQLAVNGVFGDPQPYDGRYPLRLPNATGVYTVAARLFDRAGNSTVVSTTVTLAQALAPLIRLEQPSDIGATLAITPTDPSAHAEAQVGPTPDFAGAAWQPLPLRQPWLWAASRPRVAWLRFRDAAGAIGPAQAIGPDAQRVYLPVGAR